MVEGIKNTKIDNIYMFVKLVQFIMAALMILQGTIRLFSASNFHTFTGFCITGYLYIFAISIICIECNLLRARVWFYFMNFSMGKAIFYGVVSLLCFGSGAEVTFIDILVGIVCGGACVMFIFFHLWFGTMEAEHVNKKIQEMNDRLAGRQ